MIRAMYEIYQDGVKVASEETLAAAVCAAMAGAKVGHNSEVFQRRKRKRVLVVYVAATI